MKKLAPPANMKPDTQRRTLPASLRAFCSFFTWRETGDSKPASPSMRPRNSERRSGSESPAAAVFSARALRGCSADALGSGDGVPQRSQARQRVRP
eukprot:6192512-Pleurochrysis_carterae.AAC.3